THDALAQKDLRFRTRVVPELALASVKTLVAVVLAFNGFGVWSLVFGHIAGVAGWTIFLWILVPWRPSRRFPRDLLVPMLRYGRGIIAVNVLGAIVHHSDLAIVGRLLGASALGLYQMAQKISEATVIVLLWAVAKVLFPAFSRIHAEGRELKKPYLFATRCVSAIMFPAAAGLALVARPLVLIVLGPTWIGAAPILTGLAAYAGIRSLSNHAGDLLKATGRAQLLAGVAAAKAVVLIPALVVAAMRDAATVAMALAAVELLFAAVTLTVVSRLIEVPLLAVGRAFLPAATAVSAMAAYLVLWRVWAAPLGPLAELAGAIAGGALVYLGVLRLIDPKIIEWVWQTLVKRKADALVNGATT
ncbi:MAG TPA: oligosaccharide flippase family protein, partial [Thermoanaerobaculia bacterium]|nr:oligosaccharide flippase family protein [Thermoanaerobaculia bacterium]